MSARTVRLGPHKATTADVGAGPAVSPPNLPGGAGEPADVAVRADDRLGVWRATNHEAADRRRPPARPRPRRLLRRARPLAEPPGAAPRGLLVVRAGRPEAGAGVLAEPLAPVHRAPMSHATDWRCRACRTPLGHVRDGVLRPVVPVASVDGRGVARLRCPACEEARHWFPSGAAAALGRERHPSDRPG